MAIKALYCKIGVIIEFINTYAQPSPDGREGFAIIKSRDENEVVEIFTRGYGDDVDTVDK